MSLPSYDRRAAVLTVTAVAVAAAMSLSAGADRTAPPHRDAPRVERAPEVAVPEIFLAVPPAIADRDGPLPAAGAWVAWFDDRAARAVEVGLRRAHLDGWFVVELKDLGRDAIVETLAEAKFVAAAVLDRHGGLAWPTRQAFVKFRESASPTARGAAIAAAALPVESIHHYEMIPGLALVSFDARRGDEVLAEVERLAADPAVEFAEPDLVVTVRRTAVIPNDALFGQLWGLRNTGQSGGLVGFDMRSTEAWSLTTGDPSVLVMVIDTGVQLDHPDLNLAPGRDFTSGGSNGVAGGGPGNACDNHGTAVAGCVSAIIDNSIGVVGSCPGCRTVSAKVGSASVPCDGSWSGFTSWTVNALNWAAANGVTVTNNSNDYGASQSAMATAYAATRTAGVVHFASSGNGGGDGMGYPARDPSVVAVGAANRSGNRASFSSYGSGIGLMAPGAEIGTTDRTGAAGYVSGDYVSINGTSFASPYAAGVAGLMRSLDATLTALQIEQILFETARDMGSAGYDILTGWGLVDARAALERVWQGVCPADFNYDRVVDGADIGLLLLQWNTNTPQYDLNDDGIVDGGDIGFLLLNWGACP